MGARSSTHAFWRARLAVRRAGVQWQLLSVVTLIAILAGTLVTSLTLLVSATETGAVRGALAESAASPAELRVTMSQPTQSAEVIRPLAEDAISAVLGDAATWESRTMASSGLIWVRGADRRERLIYFGELEGIEQDSTLTAGSWPAEGSRDQVALPAAGAAAMGLAVGDTLVTRVGRDSVGNSVTVAGLYVASEDGSGFWHPDRLGGEGHDPEFAVPGTAGAVRTDLVGPVVMAAGAMDAALVPVDRYVVRVTPSFATATVDSLDRLALRLSTAADDVPMAVGGVASAVAYSSGLDATVRGVTSAMAVTRSTVVAVSLLLLVLAVAALSQAARLLTEARAGERHLMRARGATSAQILGLAVVEAGLIAAGAALLSAVLARLAYQVVAAQPAMIAARMPADSGLPPVTWIVAAVTACLFVVVLVAPLLRAEGSFHEGEQGGARQQRFSGLQRSGLDVALVVLAGIAYWQLLRYQGSSAGSAFGVDPVLAAGPTIIMLAGALIAVRLVPTAARLAEGLASRSRGAVVSLAAWEVGRRAQRATAAVLLLTLGLAIGTFGYSFLDTWRQSQLDQAAFALGSPLRLTAAEPVSVPSGAQPVLRLEGVVTSADEQATALEDRNGESTEVIGLTAETRGLLTIGRLADAGGAAVDGSLDPPEELQQTIALPDGTVGIAATVSFLPDTPLDGATARLRVLVQDEGGLQSLVTLGTFPIADGETPLRGLLPDGTSHDGLEIVGYQVQAFIQNPTSDNGNEPTASRFFIKELASLGDASAASELEDYPVTPVEAGPVDEWRAAGQGSGTKEYPRPNYTTGWQLGLSVGVPADLGSRTVSYSQMAWPIVSALPAVLSGPLAQSVRAEEGDRFGLIIDGVALEIQVRAIAPTIPGLGSTGDLGPLGGDSGGGLAAVVVDEDLLARAMFQVGSPTAVREWWMPVPAGESGSTLAQLAVTHPTLGVQSADLLGLAMQQHPVRVATQAALWLVIGGAVALATAGFAVHATGSLRSRATEFAQLRAVGLTRRRLIGIIGLESLLLCALGALFGVALGLVLAWLVAPLIGVSADGAVPVPSVEVRVPVLDILTMVGLLGVVLAIVVGAAARAQRVAEPATALRQGEGR